MLRSDLRHLACLVKGQVAPEFQLQAFMILQKRMIAGGLVGCCEAGVSSWLLAFSYTSAWHCLHGPSSLLNSKQLIQLSDQTVEQNLHRTTSFRKTCSKMKAITWQSSCKARLCSYLFVSQDVCLCVCMCSSGYQLKSFFIIFKQEWKSALLCREICYMIILIASNDFKMLFLLNNLRCL